MTSAVEQLFQQPPEQRHFAHLPKIGKDVFFKSEFAKPANNGIWQTDDFTADGIWPEMIQLAEAIAAAI